MKVVFDKKALSDIDNIYDWIARDSPRFALRVIERILASVDNVAVFPGIGRPGHEPGLLEWPVPQLPYTVSYQIDRLADVLTVVAVFHQAQDRPFDVE